MIRNFSEDTIAAISTPLGEGGIGVVRLSGKKALEIADKLFESKKKLPVASQASHSVQYGHIVLKDSKSARRVIDEVLVLVMRTPKSYTREDVVEISAHAGPAVLQAILELAIQNGARLAEKGEFTKRAFLNGRLDLLQAEAVLDLIQAKTSLTREWAASQLDGVLSRRIQSIRRELIEVLSHLEASIDFPDDFPETDSMGVLGRRLEEVSRDLEKILAGAQFGVVVKRGLRVVLSGCPNVGKSSLMNALSRSNRVIVTPYPGTTRDIVEEEIQIRGIPVRLLDTAGIQDTKHPIEKEGVDRSRKAIDGSDLVLYVLDASQGLTTADRRLLEELDDRDLILVVNKADLPSRVDRDSLMALFPEWAVAWTSCMTGDGIDELDELIYRYVTQGNQDPSTEIVISSVRQKDLLEKALKAVEDSRNGRRNHLSPEMVAVDVRLALDCLGGMVGEVLTEDILEVLFSQFCVGK